MNRIVEKEELNDEVVRLAVESPLIARKARPGQFIILRVEEGGERIPLTVADTDRAKGLVTIIFQIVGYTTERLSQLEAGDMILDFVGPLGVASELEGIQRACVIGGGLGVAIAYPQAKVLHQLGASVDVISGFRKKDLVILEKEFEAVSDRHYVCTDDGSYGYKGYVSGQLESLLRGGKGIRYGDRRGSVDDDESCMRNYQGSGYQDSDLNELHHVGWDRDVRRLPSHCRGRDKICLCGWS